MSHRLWAGTEATVERRVRRAARGAALHGQGGRAEEALAAAARSRWVRFATSLLTLGEASMAVSPLCLGERLAAAARRFGVLPREATGDALAARGDGFGDALGDAMPGELRAEPPGDARGVHCGDALRGDRGEARGVPPRGVGFSIRRRFRSASAWFSSHTRLPASIAAASAACCSACRCCFLLSLTRSAWLMHIASVPPPPPRPPSSHSSLLLPPWYAASQSTSACSGRPIVRHAPASPPPIEPSIERCAHVAPGRLAEGHALPTFPLESSAHAAPGRSAAQSCIS